MLALMTERMKKLPRFHRFPVAVIAASLIGQAALQLNDVDRSDWPLWWFRDLGFFWIAGIAAFLSWADHRRSSFS